MQKNYVLDTNVLLQDANALEKFDDNYVYIPLAVVDELDNLKNNTNGETAYNARRANQVLKRWILHLDKDYIPLKNNGRLYFVLPEPKLDLFVLDMEKNDHQILAIAKYIKSKDITHQTILVTNDISLQIKAKMLGVSVQDYKNQQLRCSYTGRTTYFNLMSSDIDNLYKEGYITLPFPEIKEVFTENQYILVQAADNPQKQALTIFQNGLLNLVTLSSNYDNNSPLNYLKPRNLGQKFAIHALNSDIPLTILCGPAGTAKTFLALVVGLHKVRTGQVRQVLLLRPQSFFDSEIGFLPGDEQSKIDPLMRPFYDNLECILEMMNYDREQIKKEIESLFASGILRAESFSYIRGRSITNSFIILDEAQNATRSQIQGAVTRAGIGSKIVMCGDPEQIDNPRVDTYNNGLVFAMNSMKNSPNCCQITFKKQECCRSVLAEDATYRMFKE